MRKKIREGCKKFPRSLFLSFYRHESKDINVFSEKSYIYYSFGFVEMGSEKEAMEAAKALDGTKLLGRQVGRFFW